MIRLLLGAIVALSVAAGPALAQEAANRRDCSDTTFDVRGNDLILKFDPFNSNLDNTRFTVVVKKKSDAITSVRFMIVDREINRTQPQLTREGPDEYSIELASEPGRKVFAVGSGIPSDTHGAIASDFGRDNQANVDFILRVPDGQATGTQKASEDLEITFQCRIGDAWSNVETQYNNRVQVDLRPKQGFSASFNTGGRRQTISFGTISSASGSVTRDATILVKSTSPYEMTIDSENDGVLLGEKGSRGLPYSMTLDGQPSPPGSVCRFAQTPVPLGTSQPLTFVLDTTTAGSLRAGTYRDVVTVTLRPRDGVGPAGCTPGIGTPPRG